MSLKAQAAGVAIGGAVILLGLWYVKRKTAGTVSAIGNAIGGTASDLWSTANTPVFNFGSGTVDSTIAAVGNNTVAAPTNVLNDLGFGGFTGTTLPGDGVLGTLKAGPLGGLWGMLTGDGNSNIFGPAPSAGLDYGTGANDWSN